MMSDGLIFDVDGTLWNACAASARGWNLALESLGIGARISALHLENVAGKQFEECADSVVPGARRHYPELLPTITRFETETVASDGGTFYDGAVETVMKLAELYPLFLVSNCLDWYMDLFLSFSGLSGFVRDYDCYGISGVSKGEMLKKMKTKHGLKSPVYIGDTSGDFNAAREAGIPFIHAGWGFGSPEGDYYRCGSFPELYDFLHIRNSSL